MEQAAALFTAYAFVHCHTCLRTHAAVTGCSAGGDALIYGEALSAPGGVDRIRARMGVCPQFDILWSELTGLEHMLLYGSIKVRGFVLIQPCGEGGAQLHHRWYLSSCS